MNVPTQAPPPAKKGMGPLAWIGIGCGVVIVIGIIVMGAGLWWAKNKVDEFKANPAMAAATLIVKANPDLELVSSDPKTNTMTIKNKKTGETMTWNAEDIKNGKVSVTTDKGTATFDAGGQNGGGTLKVTNEKGEQSVATFGGTGGPQNLPSWVPSYPNGQVQGTFDTTGPQGRTAAFTVSTGDATDKVLDWYEAVIKAQGFKTEKSTYTANGQSGGTVTGKADDDKRTVNVLVASADGKTQATVTFEEKK
jgi:hypothetical protein